MLLHVYAFEPCTAHQRLYDCDDGFSWHGKWHTNERSLFKFIRFSMNTQKNDFDEMWIHSLSYFIHKHSLTHARPHLFRIACDALQACSKLSYWYAYALCECVCVCPNSNLTVNNLTFINQVQHVQMLITYICIEPIHTRTRALIHTKCFPWSMWLNVCVSVWFS